MPELPEVETIVREMREASVEGLTIQAAHVFWDRSIAYPSPQEFCQRIVNQSIIQISRRGKWIVFALTKETLYIHLRMTGKFSIDRDKKYSDPHERVRLSLSDGRILHFMDQRKFGRWMLSESQTTLNHIGVEPLSSDFTLNNLQGLLKERNSKIKPFLLNQVHIAGIGNIYADEALWLAKIHPERKAGSLNAREIKALHQAIISVLKLGIENTGTTLGSSRANYFSMSGRRGQHQHQLNVFRREGLPCPRCQTIIEKMIVAQRGTHFCPCCQPDTRILATSKPRG